MPKQRNIIQEVLTLVRELQQERQKHQERLDAIDAALAQIRGVSPVPPVRIPAVPTPAPKASPPKAAPGKGSGARGPREGNTMTMQQAIARVTAKQPLGVTAIVAAMKAVGYKFKSSVPANSVGAYLYSPGKKHFKRVDGKFSPIGSASAPAATSEAAQPAMKKRKISAAGRKAIAEAARKMWAARRAKAAGK